MAMADSKLFQPISLGNILLQHRVTPHTPRSRTAHVQDYYAQRASTPGTLLITEATFIAPRAGGFNHVPGIWSAHQIEQITDAVHANDSHIYLQLWALGRAARPSELTAEDGSSLPYVSASDIPLHERPSTEIQPRPLSIPEIHEYVALYASAASNAVHKAGFDGVESMHSGSDTSSIVASSGSPPGSNLAAEEIQDWASDVAGESDAFDGYSFKGNEVKHHKRSLATSAQLKVLEGIFKRDKYPTAALRTELASQLNMTARGVQVWFQNRRAKEKTKAAKGALEAPKDVDSPFPRSSEDPDEQLPGLSTSSSPRLTATEPPSLHVVTDAVVASWGGSPVVETRRSVLIDDDDEESDSSGEEESEDEGDIQPQDAEQNSQTSASSSKRDDISMSPGNHSPLNHDSMLGVPPTMTPDQQEETHVVGAFGGITLSLGHPLESSLPTSARLLPQASLSGRNLQRLDIPRILKDMSGEKNSTLPTAMSATSMGSLKSIPPTW
ncbi:hypothetical protein B0H16DRAFT_1878626 [Mycena metata]|uniref:Homeobox domain-containing protein n=1 Tax=Mycena metata TaxID=1033252 RepID=A0AAD7KAF8_9AGAR|nr:hypothetical protein B0H16DRAFT_1878626 [Mycena metata]